ncbi:protein FAR1-RELATED SEQUENCE 5-like isoform X2 [Asparagus officinalis]|uniref:protein FAR1-RELATED SEQUENCE 5-like isoform X1 n=1 Tax=Asparagus officinalis TaxID=4686 RepID=UPI00098E53EE|nr:protein FAR1-RELATED SEQUENCE 5-like isoform X1 [Asparagus officinalis]XP_020251247.1 protein FAR1-RELATED SEQUENCE 5-like isoform X2 [Asparagus officinalis]
MKKRNNRQVVDRSVKFPSRQALAERRRRGFGGKFLSKEESQTLNRQDEPVEEEEPEVPEEVIANAGGAPVVGMLFENDDKAYQYYINYAGNKGFSVRKGWWDKSARNVTRSRVYVCSREGFRPKNPSNEVKRSRPETRTGCPARMAIKVTSSGRYRVTEFVPEHNHQLAAPLDIHMLKSQKPSLKAQSGRTQQNGGLIPSGYKNYIRAKRKKDMKVGDARAISEYLQKMKGENPSFYCAIQVDEDDQMTNVFWADARSMADYYYFGDVVCFDTSYKPQDYGRPLAHFIGINHHKQLIILGAALLYDETVESFKWLFETFKTAMSGKQPKTLLTDHCPAISDAIAAVWPGTVHRFCVWQIYQNSVKHLTNVFESSETFAHDFCRCLYDFEEEEEFLSAWEEMLDKYSLKDNEWLAMLFAEREKWSSVYGRQAFSADIQSTLRGESLTTMLKEYLNYEMDLTQFFKQYEKSLSEGRHAELQADYHANQGNPRIPPLRLLWQAASAYTPAVFDMFRREFELFMDCMVYNCGEAGTLSQYEVTTKQKNKSHFVRFDSSDGTVICTCKKFEFAGIQCCHVLKVLDFRNIKELPPQCILKRWRKDAKAGSFRENHGFSLDADPSSSVSKRYNALCRVLFKIAERAADNIDAFTLMASQSDQLLEQVEHILQTKVLEKPSLTNVNKGQITNVGEGQVAIDDSNNGTQQTSGRRKKDTRRRNHNGTEMNNKRQKMRKGQSDEADAASRESEPPMVSDDAPSQTRNPSNQFFTPSILMQGTSFSACHQFGLSAAQGFQAMTQFGQDSSASTLQQPFHVGTHLGQSTMQGFPTPDMHPLQFVGSNPQLDQPSSDQGSCAIPVWDFL